MNEKQNVVRDKVDANYKKNPDWVSCVADNYAQCPMAM